MAFGLCSAFPFDFISAVALLGSALLARARANAWSYETSSRQNGFTLIEALVVGIIGSILAGMFIAFMYVHNDAVNGGVARGILLTQSEIVSNRIAAAVRSSNGVFTKGDAWSPNPQLTPKATDTLICLRRPGDTIAIFRIGLLHRLREGTGLGNLPYFKTGRDTVSLVAGSSFWLSADRKRVTLNLTFT